MKRIVLLIGLIILTSVQFVFAGVEEYAVQVSVKVQENPPELTFSWNYDPTAEHYYVYRKVKTDPHCINGRSYSQNACGYSSFSSSDKLY